ncbi:MAG: hypothetical protein KDB14_13995 [Planctomycetales bacterium]|nr:hypothetical protein [Planctomycetales bacterium]
MPKHPCLLDTTSPRLALADRSGELALIDRCGEARMPPMPPMPTVMETLCLGQTALRIADAKRRSLVLHDVARSLLTETRLNACGSVARIVEIELYCCSDAAPDPFAHCHPLQGETGRWYLHRVGAGYRGGSFKGIDITFGADGGFGGVLIRGLEVCGGKTSQIVDGPSLCVDWLMRAAGVSSPRELDERVGLCRVDDPAAALRLELVVGRDSSLGPHKGRLRWRPDRSTGPHKGRLRWRPDRSTEPTRIWSTARVGLALRHGVETPTWWAARQRFLTEPRRIRKGRPQLIIALHQDHVAAEEIALLTGTPLRVVNRYLSWHEAGRAAAQGDAVVDGTNDFDRADVQGASATERLCRQLGAWSE